MWLPSQFYIESEVVCMLEEILLQLLFLLLIGNVALTIISFVLTITLIIINTKKNHISANQ